MTIAEAINIFSGAETPLGAALTNPTELARQKGLLDRSYPVLFQGKHYPDAETAYQVLKPRSTSTRELMTEIIVAKFRQHSDLTQAVAERGGAAWLRRCSHLTNARTESAQRWEGEGLQSPFIQVLVEAYERFCRGENSELGQNSLFD